MGLGVPWPVSYVRQGGRRASGARAGSLDGGSHVVVMVVVVTIAGRWGWTDSVNEGRGDGGSEGVEGVRVGEGGRVEEESTLAHKAGSTSMGNSGGSRKPVRDAGRRGAAGRTGPPWP